VSAESGDGWICRWVYVGGGAWLQQVVESETPRVVVFNMMTSLTRPPGQINGFVCIGETLTRSRAADRQLTPPALAFNTTAAMGKRQRVYMSPGLWSVLDSDPSQGFAMMDTRAAAAEQQAQQQHQQLQAHQVQALQQQHQQQAFLLANQQMQQQASARAPAPTPLPLPPPPQRRAQPMAYASASPPIAIQRAPQPLPPQAPAAPLAWTPAAGSGAASASAASAASAMDDDSPSRFFYASPTDAASASARARTTRAGGEPAATPAPLQHPQHSAMLLASTAPAAAGRAATTDDVVAATYRPVLMNGNTPNSTSSIFCRNTVCNPDADQIILWCVAEGKG
jgi:hypothetical protein